MGIGIASEQATAAVNRMTFLAKATERRCRPLEVIDAVLAGGAVRDLSRSLGSARNGASNRPSNTGVAAANIVAVFGGKVIHNAGQLVS